MKTKQLEKGLLQLTDEGVAQLFTQFGGNKKIIGCVGELQFEVIQYRLLQEYGASVDSGHSLSTRPAGSPALMPGSWMSSPASRAIISQPIKTVTWCTSLRVSGF